MALLRNESVSWTSVWCLISSVLHRGFQHGVSVYASREAGQFDISLLNSSVIL